MTDIQDWPGLIERKWMPVTYWSVEELPEPTGSTGAGVVRQLVFQASPALNLSYIMLPLSEYQMGNLLGLLKRSREKDNGPDVSGSPRLRSGDNRDDWYWELVSLVSTACRKLGIKELRSNWGDIFSMDQPPTLVPIINTGCRSVIGTSESDSNRTPAF